MIEDLCEAKGCGEQQVMKYCGLYICEKHWLRYCDGIDNEKWTSQDFMDLLKTGHNRFTRQKTLAGFSGFKG